MIDPWRCEGNSLFIQNRCELERLLQTRNPHVESLPEPHEIDNLNKEVVALARQINSGVDRDDFQELLDSYNQELTIDERIEMHEQERDVQELESEDPVQSANQTLVGNWTEGLSLIEKG
ncbi:tigger transposable element-derived protein 1 [Trichonephila clavipes]|uniref:Tigger transposable element-derived protein 1 n=1 Tax=Trichonephila clavipes TaxID=2585209 RepID=A0A8X6SM47_TRICX|nr:tigger transposable element-derived protein 1 [Trichonephila clavipes]